MSNFYSTVTPLQGKSCNDLRQSRTLRAIRFSPPSTGNSKGLLNGFSFFLQSELLNKNVLSYCFGGNLFEISGLSQYVNNLKAYRQYVPSRISIPVLQAAGAGPSTANLFSFTSYPESYCQWGVA